MNADEPMTGGANEFLSEDEAKRGTPLGRWTNDLRQEARKTFLDIPPRVGSHLGFYFAFDHDTYGRFLHMKE